MTAAVLTFGGVPRSKLTGKGQELSTNYKRTYNIEPEAYSAYGYEAAQVGFELARRRRKKLASVGKANILETSRRDSHNYVSGPLNGTKNRAVRHESGDGRL